MKRLHSSVTFQGTLWPGVMYEIPLEPSVPRPAANQVMTATDSLPSPPCLGRVTDEEA